MSWMSIINRWVKEGKLRLRIEYEYVGEEEIRGQLVAQTGAIKALAQIYKIVKTRGNPFGDLTLSRAANWLSRRAFTLMDFYIRRPGSPLYYCKYCNQGFSYLPELRKHLVKNHPRQVVEYYIQRLTAPNFTPQTLQEIFSPVVVKSLIRKAGLVTKIEKTGYACTICGQYSTQPTTLDNAVHHVLTDHEDTIKNELIPKLVQALTKLLK